jgi:16S rRNA (adenine1518-N6/adenine1519-N6)-dimethyltransferase
MSSAREDKTPRGLPPVRKSLGQHFLNDRRILQRIVDSLELTGSETVIEIGPGRGSLTDLLVPAVRRLIVIEYDRALAAGGPYSLVGNVPYYITTPILFHALQAPRPARAVYLVQREVAARIAASPGSEEYGALSANVQAVAHAKLLFRVAPGSFHPPPKVESAVVRIEPRPDPVVAPSEETAFRRFVQDAFGMRRKQMRRVLREILSIDAGAADAMLSAASIDPMTRPETLSPEDFARLLRAAGNSS